jgi:hypothetical protein
LIANTALAQASVSELPKSTSHAVLAVVANVNTTPAIVTVLPLTRVAAVKILECNRLLDS